MVGNCAEPLCLEDLDSGEGIAAATTRLLQEADARGRLPTPVEDIIAAAKLEQPAESLDAFVAGATEHMGSGWPDWLAWLKRQDPKTVKAEGARIPGEGKLKAIEDAPGRYVAMR